MEIVEQPPSAVPLTDSISSELTITRRNLPHWQLGGSTYFVTFRVREGITLSPEERSMVLQSCLYRHTVTGEGTGEGACATNRHGGAAALGCSEYRSVGWRLHAVIVMPDHVHLLLTPSEIKAGRWVSLSQIMHGIKSTTSHRINKRRGRKGSLWQDESYDRIIRDENEFNGKLKYICDNVAKAGLAEDGFAYPFFWWEGGEE